MSSEIIQKYLENLKKREDTDKDFLEILVSSNSNDEDGKETARKIFSIIKKRYDQSKENNS